MPTTSRSLLEEARLRFPAATDVDRIERVAADIINDLCEEPPVSLEVVASYRDVASVRVEPLPFAGSLTPEAEGLVIRLNSRDGYTRRRFSGFHEVGHTFQPGYRQQALFRCKHRTPRPRLESNPEGLADAAAAELLLPRRHFVRDLAQTDFGWDGVAELAAEYEASLYATALRAVRFAVEPTLLVVLEPGYRKAERQRPDAVAKLRVVTSWPNARFPYVPRNKSAIPDGPLDRALQGDVVDELSSFTELGLRDIGNLQLSARLLPYADSQGELRRRVMALYRWPASSDR